MKLLSGTLCTFAASALGLMVAVNSAAAFQPPPPAACNEDRYVAKAPGPITGCPGRDGWQVTKLTGSDGGQRLASYCVYTRAKGSQFALPLPQGWIKEKSCRIVGALAGQSLFDASDLTSRFYNTFGKATGRVSDLRAGSAPTASVQVGVIDTAPKEMGNGTAGRHGTYNHGRNVGRVIREISCPADPDGTSSTGGCIGRVASFLGLAYLEDGTRDDVNGGFHGPREDLAKAIYDFVNESTKRYPFDRKVINLSVGWDPRWGGEDPQSEGLATALVHDAIEYASCLGVLVVASAGNKNGPSDNGPLLPAAWESEPPPTAAQCEQLLGQASHQINLVPAGVFLVSAGGVDGVDRPLGISRPGGLPRLLAYSSNISVPDDESGIYQGNTVAMSGTSMSAAVTSGAAAVVWGYNPDLTAAQVVDVLYKSASPVTGKADYCLSPPCKGLRRINVCNAIRTTCEGGFNSRCPAPLPSCTLAAAGEPNLGDLNPSVAALTAAGAPFTNAITGVPCPGGVCPSDDNTATKSPWLLPQPPPVICLPCALVTKDPLTNKIDSGDFNSNLTKAHPPFLMVSKEAGATWTGASLNLFFVDGGGASYLLGSSGADANYQIPLVISTPVALATLDFSVFDTTTGTYVSMEKTVNLNWQPVPVPALGSGPNLVGLALLLLCFGSFCVWSFQRRTRAVK